MKHPGLSHLSPIKHERSINQSPPGATMFHALHSFSTWLHALISVDIYFDEAEIFADLNYGR